MDGRKVEIQKRMGEHTIFCKKIQIITQEIESQNECAMNARKSSSNRLLLPAGILILLLMIAVGYLVSENAKYKGLARQYEMDVAEMQVLQTTLEEEYQIAQDELEALKGENEEMNTLITRQQVQLSEQKQRIDRLMRDSRNLSLARAEVEKLREQTALYLQEIEALRAENADLTAQNDELAQSLEMKSRDYVALEESSALNQRRMEEKARMMQDKIDIASVIDADNIVITGEMLKSGGKIKEKDKASKIDRLRICFTAAANAVVEPGPETFHIRLIDPRGETIIDQNAGSGLLTKTEDGEQVRYTFQKDVQYVNSGGQVCTLWDQDKGFIAGTYEVEVYNKGYRCGEASFVMR